MHKPSCMCKHTLIQYKNNSTHPLLKNYPPSCSCVFFSPITSGFFVLFFKNSICCLPSLLCLNSNFYLASFLLLSVLFVSLPLMLSFSLSNDLSASSYHISVWSELMLASVFFVLFTHIQTHTCICLSRTEGGGGYLYAAYQSAHYRQWCNTQTHTHTHNR